MAMSKFAPGHCGVGDCGCGVCYGSITGALTGPCTASDRGGYVIRASDHTTHDVLGSTSTANDGTFTLVNLPIGHCYDITGFRDGCSDVKWTAAVCVAECVNYVLDSSQPAYCFPGAGWKFKVSGCYGSALPGASIVITGPYSITLHTDSAGEVVFFPSALGTFTYTISDPSGRFNGYSSTLIQSIPCSTGTITKTLDVADGYLCCAVQQTIDPPSPYPIKTTLKITDPGGTATLSGTCGGSVCVDRVMGDVASSATRGIVCKTPDGSNFLMSLPPLTIGNDTSTVDYTVSLTATSQSCTQITPDSSFLADEHGKKYPTSPDTATNGGCPFDTIRQWRTASTCADRHGNSGLHNSIGCTINSLYPLNITFTYDVSGVWGPVSASGGVYPVGRPYAASVVVSE